MRSYRNSSIRACIKHNRTFHNKIISLNSELRYILKHTAITHLLKQNKTKPLHIFNRFPEAVFCKNNQINKTSTYSEQQEWMK
jgi:hypothetical protein